MYPCHRRRLIDRTLLMLGALLLPASVLAADAHQAVKARPGDIVLLRNVSARPAPPGMALMVDPSPRRETVRALGTEELSEANYASLDATLVQASGRGTAVEQTVGSAIGGALNGSHEHPGMSGDGGSNVVAGPLGAVGNTTRGIGEAQGAVNNPYRGNDGLGQAIGGLAFDTDSHSTGSESGTMRSRESGQLGFVELSASDLWADLSGSVTTSRYVVVDATNDASLSGNAFQNASGNIGVNVASGTGNLQANSLALAVAQPSAAPPSGGGEQ